MRTTLVLLPIVMAAGCGSDGGIDWRLPCGGSQFDDGATVASLIYTYEWDDAGRLLREEGADIAGVPTTLLEQEWDGDVLVFADYRGPTTRYTTTATVSGGKIATRDHEVDGGVAYHEEWTWSGNTLDSVTRTYSAGGLPDVVETYEDATSGYAYTSCRIDDPATCDRITVVGSEFRGDLEHWSRIDVDLGDNGSVDARTAQELERHGLVLTYDTFGLNIQSELIQTSHLEYERESDGTALTRSFEQFGVDGYSTLIEYTFECGAAE
jgi:hypothetical protein